jgi:hypothetical protein
MLDFAIWLKNSNLNDGGKYNYFLPKSAFSRVPTSHFLARMLNCCVDSWYCGRHWGMTTRSTSEYIKYKYKIPNSNIYLISGNLIGYRKLISKRISDKY